VLILSTTCLLSADIEQIFSTFNLMQKCYLGHNYEIKTSWPS